MSRRPDGALEHDVMAALWAADEPLAPNDVRERLPFELAYTTVATVLGRLHAKGLVERIDGSRAYRYVASVDEAQLAARRMGDVLAGASDRAAVLAGFVGSLSKRDTSAVKALLERTR